MKFTNDTLQVLKNFSSINTGIVFHPGNTLATVSPTKTILAKAEIDTEIEKQFAIYDLSRFLSVLSLFDSPDTHLSNEFMQITEGKKKISYTYADPNIIVQPPRKDVNFPDPDASFTLTNQNFSEVMKALGVLGLPLLAVCGEGGKMFLRGVDESNPTSDTYSVEVGETDKEFKALFKVENLKLLSKDYSVDISSKGIARFSADKVTYWIAVEKDSVF